MFRSQCCLWNYWQGRKAGWPRHHVVGGGTAPVNVIIPFILLPARWWPHPQQRPVRYKLILYFEGLYQCLCMKLSVLWKSINDYKKANRFAHALELHLTLHLFFSSGRHKLMPAVCLGIRAIHKSHPHHNQPDLHTISCFLPVQHGKFVGGNFVITEHDYVIVQP